MKFILVLALLSVILIGFEVNEIFAGGEAYQNRTNGYWLQIYMIVAVIIGTITTGIVIIYRLRKRKIIQ